MYTKVLLAALAALCCMQGIAAAAIAPTIDEVDMEAVEEVLAMTKLIASDEEFLTEFGLVEETSVQRGKKNIVTCVTSVYSALKSGKSVYELYREYRKAKNALKEAEQVCNAASNTTPLPAVAEACTEKASAQYKEDIKAVKEQIAPVAIKVVTSIISAVKSCASVA